jgi:hypothetical protein
MSDLTNKTYIVRRCNSCGKRRRHTVRTVQGKRYPRTNCTKCENRKRVENRKLRGSSDADRRAYRTRDRKMREWRASPANVAFVILKDTKQSARRKGLKHRLTLQLIEDLVGSGCAYCGNKTIRMSIDRIDNSKGYLPSNVQAACVRCNYMRRDMPYKAWMHIVPRIRGAQRKGLFGEWIPGPHKVRKYNEP